MRWQIACVYLSQWEKNEKKKKLIFQVSLLCFVVLLWIFFPQQLAWLKCTNDIREKKIQLDGSLLLLNPPSKLILLVSILWQRNCDVIHSIDKLLLVSPPFFSLSPSTVEWKSEYGWLYVWNKYLPAVIHNVRRQFSSMDLSETIELWLIDGVLYMSVSLHCVNWCSSMAHHKMSTNCWYWKGNRIRSMTEKNKTTTTTHTHTRWMTTGEK